MKDTHRGISTKYQELFNLMNKEHGILLTIAEMDEIINEVQKVVNKISYNGSLPTPEQSNKAMLRRKTKFVDNMDKFSSRKNAYKQGWKDCYDWIMSKGNDR